MSAPQSWMQITSGRCPAECQWVVARLVTHISHHCAQKGGRVTLVDAVEGAHSGIFRSALLSLSGASHEYCLDRFSGTILWRGQSPYRPDHRRKNWYVGVEPLTIPEQRLPNDLLHGVEREIDVETMRASGPGGQNVNRRESAVRIVHRPTGIQVIGREERSQEMNRKLALARLCTLLLKRAQASEQDFERQRWSQHNELQRGNPVLCFEGQDFREKKCG